MKDYTYVKPGLAAFVDVDKPVIRKPRRYCAYRKTTIVN